MAFFDVNPTSTTGVEIAAASTGNRARFISLGMVNNGTTQRMVTIYDGTAAAGTARFYVALAAGASVFLQVDLPGKSAGPLKSHFTSGSAIECNLDTTGNSSVRVYGEVVREV